ncbi:type II secretion system inner membrane protein GspF [Kordiimonas laminariae]|uniref:type II secretion system inner membrane protein GspF n=1 Tax=Kordiimonas laminariae TaxID=2917717 RepID=UPI001FF38951|nr:type II secretion system inner membrane protein GspF [Kordiimonas laminariae]MCK0068969.1 type II secretion system inner membrane protein GspF [Kordiimonas laminariae]
MQAYEYDALDAAGKAKSGIISAESERDARKRLQASSLFATSITLASEKKRVERKWFSKSDAIAPKDLAQITRQLATMLMAATNVEEALGAIAAQSEKDNIRRVMTRLRSNVMEGKRLSQAMEQERASFDALYIAMVAAGEASGDLARVLSNIADHREKALETQQKIQSALIYPIVLLVVAIGVITALMVFVVPKVVKQFESFGADLPALTQVVVGTSNFLVNYGLVFALVIAAAIGAFMFTMRRDTFRFAVHGMILKLPLIGRLVRTVNAARFARSLGTLIDGGSPVLEGLIAAKETIQNATMKKAVEAAVSQVKEGTATSSALRQCGAFPAMLAYMVAAGEKSGNLPEMLTSVASYLEREFDGFTKTALGLLEPMIVIFMGGIVGSIVLSIMLPILRLNSLVLA